MSSVRKMIYLDNAATTLRKPPQVIDAVVSAMGSFGNSARGTHEEALAALLERMGAVSPAYLARELLRAVGGRVRPVARLEESLYRSYMRTFGRRFASRQRAKIARFLGVTPELAFT